MKLLIIFITAFFVALVSTSGVLAQEKKPKKEMLNDGVIINKKQKRFDSLQRKDTALSTLQQRKMPEKPDYWQHAQSKKIMMSVACGPDGRVSLRNLMHKVNIFITDNHEVKIVATVEYLGRSSLTEKEWFARLDVSMVANGGAIQVTSGYTTADEAGKAGRPKFDTISNGVTLFDSLGNAIARRTEAVDGLLLYIPKEAALDIESKYADITLEDDIDSIDASITNGRLNLKDAVNTRVTAAYTQIAAHNIRHAKIDLANGNFSAATIDTLDIVSRNSSLNLKKVDQLKIINSQVDEFKIGQAGMIVGKKAYGDLTVSALNGSVELEGKNADVKIDQINSSVTAVKLNTQYADLQLPVRYLRNYQVSFEGIGGEVTTPFKKMNLTTSSFHTLVGNGCATSFMLNCNHCIVRF